MKKLLPYGLPVVLVAILCLFVGFPSLTKTTATHSLFDKNGVPVKNVKEIFGQLGVSIASIEEANEFAQKNFLITGDWWDLQPEKAWHGVVESNKGALLENFRALGMVDELHPSKTMYKYVLLVGATKARIIMRLDYLAELRKKGISFETIVLLGGERPLQEFEKEGLPTDITTEAEMMQYVCAQHPAFKDITHLLVNAPMVQREDGTMVRPSVDGTLAYFAQIAPADGSCLVASNSPYILRHIKAAQRILDQNRFPTDGAGEALDSNTTNMIRLFDELARAIYEEFKASRK
ncbi:MAG TPA: hypothetical protein VGT41_00910 [Candidatus Babeliales bacterium]|nr:hypothetical protein [Candidatus Babeliales bacterium]